MKFQLSLILSVLGVMAHAQEADLAQQLANPVAAIVSVPFQLNFDDNIGQDDQGSRTTVNFQPVVPFSLDNGANIVTRTIVPYVSQEDVIPGTSQSGLADVLFSAWYTQTTEAGLTWGLGPVARIPTGSDVSTETWAGGLTGIALQVSGPWTYGALANHIWDLESSPTTPTNSTFVQPFVSYTTADAWTFSATTESTYDWENDEWSVPLNVNVAKLKPLGGVPVSWMLGAGYWAVSPDNGPEGWRLRLQAQVVLPRG
ncbi:transporter [Shimia sp. R11_0]|uniref:transporter n=1 Tax=Shimia sp. R11_0 TaxID=2821096 RepID=UPI001FFE273E|nr:transporter [Shimia sp. R11_0]